MKRISLRMIALSLAGALVLSIGVSGVAYAEPGTLPPVNALGTNQELVAMLEKIDSDTFVACTDITITEDQLDEIGATAVDVTKDISGDYETVVAIKNWVHQHIKYDWDNSVKDQNAYTAFIEGEGICQAYSNLTKAMLSSLDIPCVLVNGNSSAGGHAWNMAYTQDKGWVLVDSTWGTIYTEETQFSQDHTPYYCDSIQEKEGDYIFTYFNGVAVRDYLGNDTTLDIPDNFRGVPTTALDSDVRTWANVGTFKSISFPASLKNIDQIDYAFSNFTSLEEFQVDEGNLSFTSEDGVLYNSNQTQLLVYPAGKADTAFQVPDTVTSFVECVFKYNSNLKHILIPASVTNLGKDLFYNNSITVYASAGSDAAAYAQQNGLTLKDPDAFPTHIHNLTAVPGKASTCTVKGNIPYWYCKECDKYFSDAEAKTEISKEKTELPLAQHKTQLQNQKDATCTQEGYTGDLVCTECKTVVEKGKTIAKLPHSTQLVGKKDATCTQEGYTGDLVCTECKTVVEKGEAIAKLPHSTQLVGKKDATCTQEGYTGDLVCTECKTVVEKGKTIAKLPHSTQLVDKKDATCTQEGYTGDLVCTECDTVVEKGKTIPAKGHNYEDGVCTVCGAEDPDHVEPTDPVEPSQPVQPSQPVEPSEKPQGTVTLDNNTGYQITTGNADKVFDKNTVITVESVTGGNIYTTVEKALKGVVADMKDTAILEITATLDGKSVQPDGNVTITFQIPQHLSVDHLKLYYVAENGEKEEIAITVNKDARTATASLEHFSTYVLANVVVDEDGSKVPPTGDNSQVMVYASVLALVAAAFIIISAVAVKKRTR